MCHCFKHLSLLFLKNASTWQFAGHFLHFMTADQFEMLQKRTKERQISHNQLFDEKLKRLLGTRPSLMLLIFLFAFILSPKFGQILHTSCFSFDTKSSSSSSLKTLVTWKSKCDSCFIVSLPYRADTRVDCSISHLDICWQKKTKQWCSQWMSARLVTSITLTTAASQIHSNTERFCSKCIKSSANYQCQIKK